MTIEPTWRLNLTITHDDPLYAMTGIERETPSEMEVEAFFPTLDDLVTFVDDWAIGIRLVMPR
jgi:hypothetical protein